MCTAALEPVLHAGAVVHVSDQYRAISANHQGMADKVSTLDLSFAGDMHFFDTLTKTWARTVSGVSDAAKLVPVRHTACMVGSTLHVIGGGAMCFSFGSTFSEVSFTWDNLFKDALHTRCFGLCLVALTPIHLWLLQHMCLQQLAACS